MGIDLGISKVVTVSIYDPNIMKKTVNGMI